MGPGRLIAAGPVSDPPIWAVLELGDRRIVLAKCGSRGAGLVRGIDWRAVLTGLPVPGR